jgi:hypothetical protein
MTLTGLSPVTYYYIAMKAYDSTGAVSTISNVQVVHTNDVTKTLYLSWDQSTSPGVDANKVYQGILSGIYADFYAVGLTTSAVIPNLAWGQNYCFAATALRGAEESVFSNERCDTR